MSTQISTQDIWLNSLNDAKTTLNQFLDSPELIKNCVEFSTQLIKTVKSNGNIFSCGNGGSHCDAMHFAEELTGKFRKDRPPMGALALGDSSHVTCVSNDYGFEHIFSRQLEGLGRSGDTIIGLSTSGNSQNIINAFETAKSKGIFTVALLGDAGGSNGGKIKALADLAIVVPAQTSDRIQEVHIKLIHTVIESIERELFSDHYQA